MKGIISVCVLGLSSSGTCLVPGENSGPAFVPRPQGLWVHVDCNIDMLEENLFWSYFPSPKIISIILFGFCVRVLSLLMFVFRHVCVEVRVVMRVFACRGQRLRSIFTTFLLRNGLELSTLARLLDAMVLSPQPQS